MKILRVALEKDIRKETRKILVDLWERKTGIDLLIKILESIKANMETPMRDNFELKQEKHQLELRCDSLERYTKESVARVVNFEQYSRNANIKFKGIVKSDSGNAIGPLGEIGEMVVEPSECSDIAACHRVPTPDSGKRYVIVQFQSWG